MSAADQYRLAGREQLPGKRILVLEDNEAWREILQGCLERWGMRVTLAENCRHALRIVDSKRTFHFGLFDHTLPDGVGDDVARRFHEFSGRVLIYMSLTGNRYLPDKSLYDASMEKPITTEALRKTMVDLMRRKCWGDGERVEAPLPR